MKAKSAQEFCIQFMVNFYPSPLNTMEKPVLTGYKKYDWIRLLYFAPRVGFKALLRWIASLRNRLFLPRLGSEELEHTVGTAADLKAKT